MHFGGIFLGNKIKSLAGIFGDFWGNTEFNLFGDFSASFGNHRICNVNLFRFSSHLKVELLNIPSKKKIK